MLPFIGNAQKLERFRAADSRPYGRSVRCLITSNTNLSACLRKATICCLLDANGKRAQKSHGKAALVSGCVPRQSQKAKGYFKTAHQQRGPTPVCFSRPIPLAGNNLTNRHLKSPFLPAMRTVLPSVYANRSELSIGNTK